MEECRKRTSLNDHLGIEPRINDKKGLKFSFYLIFNLYVVLKVNSDNFSFKFKAFKVTF